MREEIKPTWFGHFCIANFVLSYAILFGYETAYYGEPGAPMWPLHYNFLSLALFFCPPRKWQVKSK